jgi:hypothetical protein
MEEFSLLSKPPTEDYFNERYNQKGSQQQQALFVLLIAVVLYTILVSWFWSEGKVPPVLLEHISGITILVATMVFTFSGMVPIVVAILLALVIGTAGGMLWGIPLNSYSSVMVVSLFLSFGVVVGATADKIRTLAKEREEYAPVEDPLLYMWLIQMASRSPATLYYLKMIQTTGRDVIFEAEVTQIKRELNISDDQIQENLLEESQYRLWGDVRTK